MTPAWFLLGKEEPSSIPPRKVRGLLHLSLTFLVYFSPNFHQYFWAGSISQVLPVLTLAYYAPVGSTILLEEPEIHLHPLAQSVLAELFVEISKERKVQFIVETHSEHLFRRMQTLLAKGKVTLNNCAMYFVERNGADAKLLKLEANEYGAISNWPPKFFGDAMGEAREQAKARADREPALKGQ